MSAVSMFYGIIIRMFDGEDYGPCFYASYQKYSALFSPDGDVIQGFIPKRQTKFISAWAEIHREELVADWELAVRKEQPFRIDPLK